MARGSRRRRGIADWLLLGATPGRTSWAEILVCAAFVATELVGAQIVSAQVIPPTGGFEGHYQASSAVIRSEVSSWGEACGVKPQSYTAAERPLVEVGLLGAHLELRYPDRKLRTDRCWSPNPIVRLASVTASDTRWRAECRTPRDEAKQEFGTYTVTATGPYTLELVEESNYDWPLKAAHCVARVRILQQLERVPKERTGGTARLEPKLKATAAGATPAAAATVPPCVPGLATRLRIRPNDARIEPGQRVCFTLQGIDAEGCASEVELTSVRWELKKPDAARAQLGDGCFRAAASAADAEGTFRVTAVHDGLRADATVSVGAPDLSDITVRRGISTGPSDAKAPPTPTIAHSVNDTGVKAAAVKPRNLTTLWIAVAGALALLAGGLVIAMQVRQKPAPAARRSSLPVPPVHDVVALPPLVPPAEPVPGPTPSMAAGPMICPKCRRGYAPGALQCEGDGTALIAYTEFVRHAKEAEATSIAACPSCGVGVAAGSIFCGGCGTRLISG